MIDLSRSIEDESSLCFLLLSFDCGDDFINDPAYNIQFRNWLQKGKELEMNTISWGGPASGVGQLAGTQVSNGFNNSQMTNPASLKSKLIVLEVILFCSAIS
jgi:hypothetical protein